MAFSVRIRAKIVSDRIFFCAIFGVKTNVLCALKKLYSLAYKKERDNLSLTVCSWITQLDRLFGMAHGIFDHGA